MGEANSGVSRACPLPCHLLGKTDALVLIELWGLPGDRRRGGNTTLCRWSVRIELTLHPCCGTGGRSQVKGGPGETQPHSLDQHCSVNRGANTNASQRCLCKPSSSHTNKTKKKQVKFILIIFKFCNSQKMITSKCHQYKKLLRVFLSCLLNFGMWCTLDTHSTCPLGLVTFHVQVPPVACGLHVG
jgi:hypothetical protein